VSRLGELLRQLDVDTGIAYLLAVAVVTVTVLVLLAKLGALVS
jgi:hypothetical protein